MTYDKYIKTILEFAEADREYHANPDSSGWYDLMMEKFTTICEVAARVNFSGLGLPEEETEDEDEN